MIAEGLSYLIPIIVAEPLYVHHYVTRSSAVADKPARRAASRQTAKF